MVIAIMALWAGSCGSEAIAEWVELVQDGLPTVLSRPLGVPRKGVFRRELSALQPVVFQA